MIVALMIGAGMTAQALLMTIVYIAFGVINIIENKNIFGIFLIVLGLLCFIGLILCVIFSWAIVSELF